MRVGGSLPLSIIAIVSFIEVNDNYIDSYTLVCFVMHVVHGIQLAPKGKYNYITYLLTRQLHLKLTILYKIFTFQLSFSNCCSSNSQSGCWWIYSVNSLVKKRLSVTFTELKIQLLAYCNRAAILKCDYACRIINQIRMVNGQSNQYTCVCMHTIQNRDLQGILMEYLIRICQQLLIGS